MKDSFNSNFYITTAAVAPLLYITLFLQGQAVQNISQRIGRQAVTIVTRLADWSFDKQKGKLWIKKPVMVLMLILIMSPVLGVISAIFALTAFAGLVAEGFSLLALYYQSDSIAIRVIVLWSILGLLVLVCANPIMTIMRNFYWAEAEESGKKPDSTQKQEVDRKKMSKTDRSPTGLGWPSSD